MSVHHICPRCRLTVAEERLKIVPFVCDHCGFTLAKPNSDTSTEKSDSRLMIAIAGGVVLMFVLLASHVELRWLQTRDFVGLSSMSSLERLTQICTELRKLDCVEHSLARQSKFDQRRSVRQADFLISRGKYKEAVQSMRKYIAGGKADANAYAAFGRALAEAGQMEEASKYFERIVNTRKPSLDHVQAYVKYLTRAKRFDQALSVILRVRRTNINALPVEYRVISEMRGAANNRYVAGKR